MPTETITIATDAGHELTGSLEMPTGLVRGAALFGHAECISLLVEAGAAVNQSSERGKTPLMGAAMNGHAAALELLLRHRRCVQSRAMARPKRLIGPGERL